MAGDFDDVSTVRELLAHRLAPVVRSRRHADHAPRGAIVWPAVVTVTALARDQLAGREDARADDAVLLDPGLETKRDVALGAYVAYAGDAAFDVVAETLDPAQC